MAWGEVKGSIIHHTAGMAPADHLKCGGVVDAIRRYHKRNGYRDIAYNWVVCAHGKAFQGRGWDDNPGANGTKRANAEYAALCVLGDSPDATQPVSDALVSLIREQRAILGGNQVRAHNEFVATTCPGGPLNEWIRKKGYIMADLTEEEVRFLKRLARSAKRNEVRPWEPVKAAKLRHRHEATDVDHNHPHTHPEAG